MIYRVSPLPFALIDSSGQESSQAIPSGQTSRFLDLLVQAIAVAGVSRPSVTKGGPSSFPAGQASFPLLEARIQRKDLKSEVFRFVFDQEGSGYVSRDGGSESSRYGILQATASRYGYPGSVRNMSRQEAEEIYEKIWQESGAENLPRDLAFVHFDTYVNSPAAANTMLKVSGGSPEAYIELRAQRYRRLSHMKPERYEKYVKGWMNRIANLKSLVAENRHASSARAST